MSVRFRRPTGAPANVAELEYCSALMQTSPHLCTEATVTAVDIQHHLISRHGVKVSIEEIEQQILGELAGGRRRSKENKNKQQEEEDEAPSTVPPSPSSASPVIIEDASNSSSRNIEIFMDAAMDEADADDDSTQDKVDDLSDQAETEENGGNLLSDKVEMEKNGDTSNPTLDGRFVSSIDLLQQTALLLIPELQRMRQSADAEHSKEEEPGAGGHTEGSIQAILLLILERAGLEHGVLLTKDVMRSILVSFHEWIPKDDEDCERLLDEMIEACCDVGTSSVVPVLDETTLLRALTGDTEIYDPDWDDRPSTHYQDALTSKPLSQKVEKNYADAINAMIPKERRSSLIQDDSTACGDKDPLKRIFTASTIDNTADTFRSFGWSILSWMVVSVCFFAFFLEGLGVHQTLPTLDCDDTVLSSFGCKSLKGIVVWLEVFLEISTLGVAFLYLVSLGNSSFAFANERNAILGIVAGMTAVTFASHLSYKYEVDFRLMSTEKEEGKGMLYLANVILGGWLLIVQIIQLVRLLLPTPKKIRPYLASGTLKLERWIKHAATYKVQQMILNALCCHTGTMPFPAEHDNLSETIHQQASSLVACVMENDRHSDAMLGYLRQVESSEEIGGIVWFWRRILFSRELFSREGVWLFPRLLASNCVQWFIFVSIPFFWGNLATLIQQNEEAYEPTVQVYELQIALTAGAVAALLATFSLACVYIPSAAATVLRYRSGMIGCLKDEGFQVYRSAVDHVAILFGSAFWGAVFTGFTVWILVTALVFLLVWSEFRDVVTDLLAFLIGIAVTIILKMLVLRALRLSLYRAFYRHRPAVANFMTVVVECWNLALSTGYILVRLSKLSLLAILYIGRVDTFFLDPSVGWVGSVPLDSYPIAFRKDLLLHEAHRHPFIERLATLYMLKLRHKADFGRRGSATWRILLVRALMPWLQKYRGLHRTGVVVSFSRGHSAHSRGAELSSEQRHRHHLEREIQRLQRENMRLKQTLNAQPRRAHADQVVSVWA